MTEKVPITGLTAAELTDFVESQGEPRYRGRQIFKGLYERRLRSFEEMTDLPKAFREKLNEIATPATVLPARSWAPSRSSSSSRS